MAADRRPRRLSSEARREQLVGVAEELAARDGYAGFSLDEIAERAHVTRNLLYHYFPRGRQDVLIAVIERAGEELTRGWLTDPEIPIEERLAANFLRVVEQSEGPSASWLVHRQARASVEPEVQAVLARYEDRVVSSIALNHLGTEDPPPLARVAITAFVAFAEQALDEAREAGLPREDVLAVLQQTLVAAIAAATALQA